MRRVLREITLDSAPIRRALDSWLGQHPRLQTLAVYSPLPGEVDLTPLASRYPERRWAFPRVTGDHLVFHLVIHADRELVPGVFGILEPSPELPEIPVAEIDAFLCPGLAFDLHGGRLGRGKGFYDRMLAHARPDALKTGVCFPCQIVADTHSEAHDMRMDEVVCGESVG
jgi:5-formyltetrahydrofolate cyclo-ligase